MEEAPDQAVEEAEHADEDHPEEEEESPDHLADAHLPQLAILSPHAPEGHQPTQVGETLPHGDAGQSER